MLDTNARKYLDPFFRISADLVIRKGFKADHVTLCSFALGTTAAVFLLGGFRLTAVALLWISGFFDALDGTVARRTHSSTPWGALMDLTFDRLVELGLILALGARHSEALFPLLLLACAIVFSMTVFLAAGALMPKTGEKAFRYQTGLAERTEGFLLFSLMILFPRWLSPLTIIFTGLVAFTGCQRLLEARRLLKEMAGPAGKKS